jgi:hypothetical protein
MVGRDPGHETRQWSIGVVTLDPPERSIGDRLGAGGVVGTEVDVGSAALPIAVMTVRNLAADQRQRPQMRLVGGVHTPANMRARKLTVEEVGPMTGGDLSEPAHRAAQQAYEAAARLDEQAAAELDQAAAHCRVAATHFRGAEMPRGAAHAWAVLGHLREAELRLEEQARTHRLKARL